MYFYLVFSHVVGILAQNAKLHNLPPHCKALPDFLAVIPYLSLFYQLSVGIHQWKHFLMVQDIALAH